MGCGVARSGGSHFWLIPVVLGVGFFYFFVSRCSKHSVKYLSKYFPRMQTNTEKQSFFLKSFTFENILHCKIFFNETNGA